MDRSRQAVTAKQGCFCERPARPTPVAPPRQAHKVGNHAGHAPWQRPWPPAPGRKRRRPESRRNGRCRTTCWRQTRRCGLVPVLRHQHLDRPMEKLAAEITDRHPRGGGYPNRRCRFRTGPPASCDARRPRRSNNGPGIIDSVELKSSWFDRPGRLQSMRANWCDHCYLER